MTKIPLFKVLMSSEASEAVAATLRSGVVTEGPKVVAFEEALAPVLGGPVLSVNSGTSALHLAGVLLDLKPGDEVISTPITCAATNLALLHAGATIVWADVDPTTGLIDPESVAAKVTAKTRAVMAVDWAGALVDGDLLREATGGAPVIEDAAHAFGALRTQPLPELVCWSFQAIKHLTTGDGGGLYVRDPVLREKARRLRWFGIDRQAPGPNIDKSIAEAGFKYHMNDIDASIGLANLPHAQEAVAKHRANAAWYASALKDVPGIRLPPEDPTSAWWLYTILLEPSDAQRGFISFMAARGVECSRVHSRNDVQPVFGPLAADELPGVDAFDGHQVAIPVGWWVGDDERSRVAEAVRDWAKTI
jgi:dTDP-4-amino-4,6-dideoxygalactose transaminase